MSDAPVTPEQPDPDEGEEEVTSHEDDGEDLGD